MRSIPLCRVAVVSGCSLLFTQGNIFFFEIFKIIWQHFSSSNVPSNKKSQAAGMTVNTSQHVLCPAGAGLLQSEFKSVVQEHEEFSLSRKMPSNTTLHECWPICLWQILLPVGICSMPLDVEMHWLWWCVSSHLGFGSGNPGTKGTRILNYPLA